MAGFTDTYENANLNYVAGGGASPRKTTLWFGFFTVAPTDSSAGTEMTDENWTTYQRQGVTNNGTNFPSTGTRTKTNANEISFGTALSADDESAVAMGIWDAETGGTLLWYKTIPTLIIQNGNPVRIPAGDASFTINGWTDAYATIILDFLVGAGTTDPRATTHYATLYTVAPTASTDGTEVSTGTWANYARSGLTNNATTWPDASGGAKTNGAAFSFGTASMSANVTVVAVGMKTASSGGTLMWFSSVGSQTVQDGNTVALPAGSQSISVD